MNYKAVLIILSQDFWASLRERGGLNRCLFDTPCNHCIQGDVLQIASLCMPPVLHFLGELAGIQGNYNGLGSIPLTNDFNTVGRMAFGS